MTPLALIGAVYAATPDRIIASAHASLVVTRDLQTVAETYVFPSLFTHSLGPLLSDLLPMRSGDFLVLKADTLSMRLLRVSASGELKATFSLPPVEPSWATWAAHAELLSDQCTVAYHGPAPRRPIASLRTVRTFDICTNSPGADLFVLPPDVEGRTAISSSPRGMTCGGSTSRERSSRFIPRLPNCWR